MKDSKLYALFRQFTPTERTDLDKILHSPWYNRRPDVLKLYQTLHKRIGKKTADLSKVSIFKAVFPKEEYDDRKIRYTMSFLLKILEQYLAEKVQDNSDLHSSELFNRAGTIFLQRSIQTNNRQ